MNENQNGNTPARTFAILIDGDNATSVCVKEMLGEVSKQGRITIRRIYGDWTTPNMNGWKERLQENAIQPVQQFRNTVGKNATDSAMIIDAMDILHAEHVNGFCLVASDSDYTRLATRLRESGAFVMGIGEKKTPKPFTSACDVFVFFENLRPGTEQSAKASDSEEASAAETPPEEALPLLRQAFRLKEQDDGWAFLGAIGASLRDLDPSFDHRTYGCPTLKALVKKFPKQIEVWEEERAPGNTIVSMRFR